MIYKQLLHLNLILCSVLVYISSHYVFINCTENKNIRELHKQSSANITNFHINQLTVLFVNWLQSSQLLIL